MSEATTDLARPLTAVTVSVVLCSFAPERWQQIVAAAESLRAQDFPPAEILLVVDHCPQLRRRAVEELPWVRVLDNDGPRGLSGARNAGVAASTGDVVAFLDDDAVAEPDWLRRLAAEYADPTVLGVGGHVEPLWESHRPQWFPPEFDWVVGCAHTGMPSETASVRNLIGANMSFRREVLATVGGFRADLGRVGSRPAGCEETELCIRAAQEFPDGVLRYQPKAMVRHNVSTARGTWRYFRARCYAEGLSKATVAQLTGGQRALTSERDYVRRVLPRGLVAAAARAHPTRGLALVTGLSTTVAGYVVGRFVQRHGDAAAARSWVRATAAATAPLVLSPGQCGPSDRPVGHGSARDRRHPVPAVGPMNGKGATHRLDLVGVWLPRAPVPVLLYHCVGPEPSSWIAPFSVSSDALDAHLEILAAAGCTAVTVSELRDGLCGGRPLPPRPVVVTFDDGFVDTLTVAGPILRRHGVACTIYLTSGFIGGTSPGGDRMLDWAQARELADQGHEIGAHTVSHPQLDTLSRARAGEEIRVCRDHLEERLGIRVRSFAYPHGYSSPSVRRQVLEAGYESACSVKNVLSGPADTPFSISRLTMTSRVTDDTLRRWVDGSEPPGRADERLVTRGWRAYRRLRHTVTLLGHPS